MNNNIFELSKFCADKAEPLFDTSFGIGALSESAAEDTGIKNILGVYRHKYQTLRDLSYNNEYVYPNSPHYNPMFNPLGNRMHTGNYLYKIFLQSNYRMLMDTDCAIRFNRIPELNYRFLQEPCLHDEIYRKMAITQKEKNIYKLRELRKNALINNKEE